VSWVRGTFLEKDKDREKPDVVQIHHYLSMETFLAIAEKETGVNQAMQSTGTTRQIVMTALYKYAGINNREIGELFGIDYSTVSQGRQRLRVKGEKNENIRTILKEYKQRSVKDKDFTLNPSKFY